MSAFASVFEESDEIRTEQSVCRRLSHDRDRIRQDAKDLARSALDIERSFEGVLRCLEQAKTRAGTNDSDISSDITKLIDEWKGHKETYRTILWKSRDLAGNAFTTADDFVRVFVEDVLADQELDIEEILEQIDDYMTALEGQRPEAQDMTDSFKNLANAIERFEIEWKKTVDRHRQKLAHEKYTRPLERGIRDVLDKIKNEQKVVLITRKTHSFPFVTHAFHAIAEVCPNAKLEEEGQSGGSSKQNDTSREQENLQTARAVEALTTAFNDARQDFKNLSSRLGQLVSVWTHIQGDLNNISGYLRMAQSGVNIQDANGGTGGKQIKFNRKSFGKRMRLSGDIYRVLCDVLFEYQRSVDTRTGLFAENVLD